MKESEKIELGQKVKNEELAELSSIMDSAASSINDFVKRKDPFKRYKDCCISVTEGAEYEINITVRKIK